MSHSDYPDHKRYTKLYARFLSKGTRYLIQAAKLQPGDRVLDLCCGSGRLALAAHAAEDLGLTVLVDHCEGMIEPDLDFGTVKAYIYVQDVMSFLLGWIDDGCHKFNVVFCQQAVNYWFNPARVMTLAEVMEPHGRFVFNTFTRSPPTEPTVIEHYIETESGFDSAVEVYYMTDDGMVHHYQSRTGYEPHMTKFHWISQAQFEDWLKPYFDVEITDDGKSAVYVCTRK